MKISKFPRQPLHCLTALLLLLGFSALLHAAAPATPAKETKRLFWKITSPTTTVYFLGSVHVATPDMYPLPSEIEAAYKDATILVVEADITKVNPNQLTMQVMSQGMYGPEDSLDKHLSPDTLKKFKDFLAASGMPFQLLQSMKPPLAAMTVEALQLQTSGLDAENGIDMHFLNAANTGKDKKIVELESADMQIKLIFAMDDKLAGKWLLESLKESSKGELDKVIKAWKEGDEKSIESEMASDEKTDADAKKMNDLMIYDRNDAMVKKIDDLLKGNEKVLVVVGAAHLLGDRGILKQLETKGYKVERPTLTAPARAAATIPSTPAR